MKTKYFLLVLILCFTATNMSSQEINILGAIQENADLYNESNSDENPDPNDPNTEEMYRERWRQYLKTAEEEYAAHLNGLGAYERCMAMMIIYLDKYYQLEELIENEANCKMKYDLYGMQLLGISASTTIMYCPEKVSNLPEEMRNESLSNFLQPYLSKLYYTEIDCYQFWDEDSSMDEMLSNVYEKFFTPLSDFGCDSKGNIDWAKLGEFANWIWQHFHPASTVTKVLEISQKMEALGCGG